ncbi:MAG: hypothetical protein Q4D81_07275, partial [Eubacteriales bacterium]|nr:hypothetical protein [Eubacteriales bacterium]
GLGDAYAGKEDWTQAVINYDEAVRTVAYKLQSEPREEKEKETAISAGRNNAVAYGSDENNSVQKDADGKDTDDNNSVVMYVTEEEKTILAVLDGMTGSAVDSDIQAAPVEGTAITVIDGEYVRDVIESRNRALEAGLTEIRESENSDAEMGDWLSKAGHPDYAPQNEALSEEKNMLTIDEAAPGQEFSEDIDVNNNDPGYAPYIKVIDDLEREYGQIELVRSDYYKSDAEAWEVEGVCLFTLL